MFPVIGRSLKSMLDYDGEDFTERFGLNFTVSSFLCCGPFTVHTTIQ